mmetsp:Transcript_2624/g.5347  ORF Transcript_2624/g.5347 Transcript_2624/m.5347 type:complete len:233 (-) Transcript_2624:2755-3453(-)
MASGRRHNKNYPRRTPRHYRTDRRRSPRPRHTHTHHCSRRTTPGFGMDCQSFHTDRQRTTPRRCKNRYHPGTHTTPPHKRPDSHRRNTRPPRCTGCCSGTRSCKHRSGTPRRSTFRHSRIDRRSRRGGRHRGIHHCNIRLREDTRATRNWVDSHCNHPLCTARCSICSLCNHRCFHNGTCPHTNHPCSTFHLHHNRCGFYTRQCDCRTCPTHAQCLYQWDEVCTRTCRFQSR